MGCNTSKVSTSNGHAQNDQQPPPPHSSDDEMVEGVVCRSGDVAENEMKAFDLADHGRVLLVRQKGVLRALGAKCTHYGAPLVNGALGDGRVRCPWHGACFSIVTGDIEDFPGVDSLPCFQVDVSDGGEVRVRARKSALKSSRRERQMATLKADDRGHMVIIGGGPSGNACAETLRQAGFEGRITMLCLEPHLPYDRVKVSKQLEVTGEQLQLRNADFYTRHNIEIRGGAVAHAIDVAARSVALADGACVPYTKLYIASGSSAARPKIPGAHQLGGIFTLRTIDDASRLKSALDGRVGQHVVVLGASFIAMEAAASCVAHEGVKSVTVVGRDEVPFRKLLGEAIGMAVKKLFEAKGVRCVMRSGVMEFQGDHGVVQRVKLNDGQVIPADVVVLGTGSTLNTDFVKDSGIARNAAGAIDVDEFLQTNVPNVFAGGDVAHAPVFAADNKKAAIGHFGLAQYHGRIAGLNMAGRQTCLRTVPFFWTMLLGKGIRYCGWGGEFDEVLYTGDVDDFKFAAYFVKDGLVTAVSTCMLPGAPEFANRMFEGRKLYRQELGANYSAWMSKEKTSL